MWQMKDPSSFHHQTITYDGHHRVMSFARRVLLPGALIAVPVAFAAASIAFAQVPSAPNLPEHVLRVPVAAEVTPAPKPVEVAPPAAPPAPAVVPPPAPAPVQGDDDDDDGGDDD